jgi:hypothetical protein
MRPSITGTQITRQDSYRQIIYSFSQTVNSQLPGDETDSFVINSDIILDFLTDNLHIRRVIACSRCTVLLQTPQAHSLSRPAVFGERIAVESRMIGRD